MTRREIESKVMSILVEDFEIDESKIVPEAQLFQDLDLDSIDAVDLVVRLQQETGKRVDPAAFRQIRTFADVVAAVSKLVDS